MLVASFHTEVLKQKRFLQCLWGSSPDECFHSFLCFGTIVQAILLACSIPMGWAYAFHQDKASSVKFPFFSSQKFLLGPVFPIGNCQHLTMAAACASRAKTLMTNCIKSRRISRDEHSMQAFDSFRLIKESDEIFSEGKKSGESNIGDSDNIRNGGKTAGRAIITWGGGIALLISESEGTIKKKVGASFTIPRNVGKITVVILVRDRCPRGKGNLPRVPMGYRGGSGG
ncbi:hypothetical protein Tco_1138265 [Tanacetum coccineum]